MNRWMKWMAPVAGLALIVGLNAAQTKADDAAPAAPAGKATVTVTVVDSNGKAVEGAKVNLLPPAPAKHAKNGQGAQGNDTTTPPPADNGPATGGKGGKQGKPTPIATGTTDKDGKAILTGIADGKYSVAAMVKGVGRGQEKLTVADGKDASVTVTLKARNGGGGGGTGGPGANGGTPPPAN